MRTDLKIGDKVKLIRWHSELNGWSIIQRLNGKTGTLESISEDNRNFTVVLDDGSGRFMVDWKSICLADTSTKTDWK